MNQNTYGRENQQAQNQPGKKKMMNYIETHLETNSNLINNINSDKLNSKIKSVKIIDSDKAFSR